VNGVETVTPDEGMPPQRRQLLEVAALVHRHLGMTIDATQLPSLAAAVGRIRPGLRADGFLRLLASWESREWAISRLVDEVTVKETYFFRNLSELEHIAWTPGLRLWNPGCATGEEPYTLAMLAAEALGGDAAGTSILATDVVTAALRSADQGLYGERSMRTVPVHIRDRYFQPHAADRYAVGTDARRPVRFARHNLVSDPIPPPGTGSFDVIVCRSVLIYFDAETARRTVAALRRALRPGGRLVLGAADRLAVPPTPRGITPIGRPGPHARAATAPLRHAARTPPPDSLDPEPHFAHGVAMQASGDIPGAVGSLRRAIYLAPDFARAAFALGGAHEAIGDTMAARRAYQQALWALRPDGPPQRLLGDREADDVAAACRTRVDRIDKERTRE
jgi:chemotaxis protein methyltransferase CheR